MPLRVLLAHSDPQSGLPLARFFRERGDQVWVANDIASAMAALPRARLDLILLDLHFQGSDWLALLRKIRDSYPTTRVILTNKYPDLQRELQAAELGANIFLRQPFTQRWIEAALRRAFQTEQPTRPVVRSGRVNQPPPVRFPMRFKITAPYLLLALLLALASAYIITQVVLESVQSRYLNQLIATGRQVADWIVREEDRMLSTERLVANTQGLARAILEQNAEGVREVAYPLAVSSAEEAIEIVDLQGLTLVSMRMKEGGGVADYTFSRGDAYFGQQSFSRSILTGQVDEVGDKYAGLAQAPWGDYFYIGGPVYDETGKIAGAVLVGRSLKTLAREAGKDSLADVTFYGYEGKPLSSSRSTLTEVDAITTQQVDEVLKSKAEASLTRSIAFSASAYLEILGPWEVRGGENLGVLGVALPKDFLVRTSSGIQLQIFLLVVGAILLVILVGFFLSSRITRPLTHLVQASNEIAQGNLEVKVDSGGNDEMAVLAYSFNYMVAGLQEGSVYRDLLGRTVSPEVRDQLRQTFTTGGIRLEGQEAVATVLLSDIRGFTSLSERTDPATVLNWLNEYFGLLVPIIQKYGGVVNKFDGDAMLTFFGILPKRQSAQNGARAACQAALEMLTAIEQLNAQRSGRGDPPLVTGIGINTGMVIAGGLGTSDRLHYTIIGDTVNTAQRLEGLTRQVFQGCGTLVGHNTVLALAELGKDFLMEPAGMYAVKGKSEQVMVYRLLPGRVQPPGEEK